MVDCSPPDLTLPPLRLGCAGHRPRVLTRFAQNPLQHASRSERPRNLERSQEADLTLTSPLRVFVMPDFFYSDPHFGHANVLGYSNRPFADVDEMDRDLIARYQTVVRQDQTVLWLGDCFFCRPERAAEILAALPGRKILCRGNHDRSASSMARIGFELVTDTVTLNIAGRTCRANHYPYKGTPSAEVAPDAEHPWPQRHQGEVLIHGHTHSTKRRNGNQIHVGVDAWDYRPVALAEVEVLVRAVFGA